MLRDQVSTKSLIVVSLCGGHPRSIEPMFMWVSKCSSIWLVSICMVKSQHSKYHWSRFSEPTCGRRSMSQSWWTCARYLIWSWIVSKLNKYRKKLFTHARVTKWIAHVLIFSSLPLTNGKSVNHLCCMSRKTITMAQSAPSTGLMCSSDGATTTHTILSDTHVKNSWTTLLMKCRTTPPQPGVLSQLTWHITCTQVSVIGSTEASSFYNKPWTRLWRQTLQSMSLENVSASVSSSTVQSQLSHTWIPKTTQNCLVTKSFGSLTTPMFTEWQSTRHSRVTWPPSPSTELSLSLTPSQVTFSSRLFIQVSGQVKNV